MAGPRLVELVGPPGAGKSTVLAALLAREPRIERPPVLRRRPAGAVRLAWQLVRVGAMLARRSALRVPSRELAVMLAYLRALPPVLRRSPAPAVVFDQGPLYTLLRPGARDPRLEPWARARLDEWRGLLDLVVLLDAPEDVLVERIDARAKAHRFKGDAGAREHVARDRALYAAAVEGLEGRPRVLRIDTSRTAPDAAAAEILAALAP